MVADGQPVDPSIVDINLLTDWMDGKGLGSGPLESVEPLAGGTQNLLLRFVRDGRGPKMKARCPSDVFLNTALRHLAHDAHCACEGK